ncbi:SIMPL domain-containing protein [Piscinibacter sp. XHJ-5]|uniref:SIMPL domain-containing protein n=1 Tax=Piscinibacter sp. XHJ-5 TaxID=3037797 RepID=UPI002452D274|nr:SIMPL domain-containing protein [Piscinibacter sp. XHJ-5]
MKRVLVTSVVALSCGLSAAARADMPPPTGVVNLSATASVEVTKDLMSVTLSTTRDGPDANAVQTALKQALDAALTEARRAAKPGQVDVQTGNFSLYPRYTNKGVMAGWQGSAELLVEGRDMPAIAQLVGRINSLTIQRVAYGLSRELRERSEAEVTAQAIARYRAKAAEYATHFGYSGYTLREVSVNASEPPVGPIPMMRAQAMAMKEDAALPVEAGKAPVTVSVTGTVQMTK